MKDTDGIVFWFWVRVCENFALKMTAETKNDRRVHDPVLESDNLVIHIIQWHKQFQSKRRDDVGAANETEK